VVDRVALEMRSTRKRTGSSNLPLSANFSYASLKSQFLPGSCNASILELMQNVTGYLL
jgi:hypothetical protein